jgi:hypothetical protein
MSAVKRLRWLLAWCLRGFAGVAVCGVGLWFWYRPTLGQIALSVANRALPDFAVEAASVERTADHLEIGNLRVRVRADGSEALALEHLSVFATWREWRDHHIREISLRAPTVEVTQPLLDAVAAMMSGDSTSAPWTIDRLRLERGQLAVKIAEAPPMEVALEVQLSGLHLGGSTSEDAAEQKIQLRDLVMRTRDAAGAAFVRVPQVEATFTWRELLENHRLATLRIANPECRYDSSVRRTFPQTASTVSSTSPAPPSVPWRIGSLQLSGGRLRLEELGAGVPALAFGVEAELHEVVLGSDPATADAEQMQVVTVRGLEVRAPGVETEPFVRAPMLRARFRWRELLEDRWINGVELERPTLHWNAAVQHAFQSSPEPATTSAPAEKAAEPYRIGVLQISRATIRAVDLGPGMPSIAFGGDAGLTEVPLGPIAEDLPEAEQAVAIRDLALQVPGFAGPPFLRVPAIYATFTWRGLLAQKRIGFVRIEQPEVHYEPAIGRALAAGASDAPKTPTAPERAWHVEELGLFDGKVHLADLGLGVPPIDFDLNTTFKDMALSLDGEALRDSLQTIELHHIGLQSPVDPFTPVLNLRTIFVRFTPAGLWRRQIEQVEVINPVLNVGEDLFWYTDRVQARDEGAAPAEAKSEPGPGGWTINRFDVTSGQLVLAFDGRPKLPLPLPFETHARHLNFDKLSDLRLTLDLIVPKQDYIYPDYELTLRGVSGHLQFSLPPAKGANNLVHTLQIADLHWKDYRARDLFLDLTFDEKAIHGNLGGKAYAGYLRGAFDFGLDATAAWNGWVSGSRVDLKLLTDAFSPEKFSLSGPADFAVNVAARAKEIDKFDGDFRGLGAGALHLGKLDDIINELPPEWTTVKRALTRIGLETVRDFAYDTAHGDFRFLGRAGRATLDLRGAGGSRRLEALVHDDARPVQVSAR